MSGQFATWPFYEKEDVDAVVDIINSGKVNYWTGTQGRLFEKEYAKYLGVNYAVVLANGTVALELALRALDIGPGDEVIVPARTFIATASAVVAVGATPVVCDVSLESQTIDPAHLQKLITKQTKAVIAVHISGWPADIDSIKVAIGARDIKLIEDCAQAHGAMYNNLPVGSLGDVATFSFCQNKIISTLGEGGLLATDNKQVWHKAVSYKDHGKNFDKLSEHHDGMSFRWLHDDFGSNFRMTEMQAAIGRNQLRKLDKWIQIRQRNAEILSHYFSKFDQLLLPVPAPNIRHAFYQYCAFVKPQFSKLIDAQTIIPTLREHFIPVSSGGCSEIYREKAFAKHHLGMGNGLHNASRLTNNCFTFEVHPGLCERDMHFIAKQSAAVFQDAFSRKMSNEEALSIK